MFNCCLGQKVFSVRAYEFAKNKTGRGEMKEVEHTARKNVYIVKVSTSVERLGEASSAYLLVFCEISSALGEQVEYFWR